MQPPSLLLFPPDDRVFATYVRRVAQDPLPTPNELRDRLRSVYPSAVVRPKERLAAFGASPTWYVFRDGAIHRASGGADWWAAPDVARIDFPDGGVYAAANAEA